MAPKTLATQGDRDTGYLFHSQRMGRGSSQDSFGEIISPFLFFFGVTACVCVCVKDVNLQV